MTTTNPQRGTLVLVVGPSGVGKDALIAYCRRRLHAWAAFPRRVITRACTDSFEDHIPLAEEEFRRQVAAGVFAFCWRAHGLGYGIPITIGSDLAAGRTVLVNASRSVIGEARQMYQPTLVVSITARPEVLASRLRERGREGADRIHQRLDRAARFTVSGPDVVTLDNSGPLEHAGEALVAILRGLPERPTSDSVPAPSGTPPGHVPKS